MEKLKLSVLFWEWESDGAMKHDEVVDQVAQALSEGGHDVTLLGVSNSLTDMAERLKEQQPQLVFNLCETFADNDHYEMNITAVLEMLGMKFTGTGPTGMALRQDKAITKKLLAFHDVRCPEFATFDRDRLPFAGKLRFPLLIKPLLADPSACADSIHLV